MVLAAVLLLSGWAADRAAFKAIGHNNLGGFSSQQLGAMRLPTGERKRNTRLLTRAALIRVERKILRRGLVSFPVRASQQQYRMRSSRAVRRWLSLLHGRGPPTL